MKKFKKLFTWLLSVILLLSVAAPYTVMAASSDHDAPVLKSLTLQEQGQTLHAGDTLHFSAEITDASPIQGNIATIGITANNVNRSLVQPEYIRLSYNQDNKKYEGSYTLKNEDQAGDYYCCYFLAADVSGNNLYASNDDSTETGKILSSISFKLESTSEDRTPPVLKSLTLKEQGQVLKTGDALHISADIFDESQVAGAYIEFKPESGRDKYVDPIYINLTYNKDSKLFEGTYTLSESDRSDKYYCYYFSTTDTSGNQAYSYDDNSSAFGEILAAISFSVEGKSDDHAEPVLKSLSLQEQGQTLKSGDTIHFSAEVTDDSPIEYGSVTLSLKPESGRNKNVSPIYVYLLFNEKTGKYEGDYTFKGTDQVGSYYCNWFRATDVYKNNLSVYDDDERANSDVLKLMKTISCNLDFGDKVFTVINDDNLKADLSKEQLYDLKNKAGISDSEVNDNTSIEFKFEHKDLDNTAVGIEQIKNYSSDHNITLGAFFDLSLIVNLDGKYKGTINNTDSPIKLEVTIPKEIRKRGREYIILRNHNGEVTEVGRGIGSTVTILTDEFSTYAIAYDEYKGSYIDVDSITLSSAQDALTVGDTVTLTATVMPANATDRSVTWSSSDDKVATVDQDGKVTAVAAGTATITATANDGSDVKGECKITVKNQPAAPVPSNPSTEEKKNDAVIELATISSVQNVTENSAGVTVLDKNGKTVSKENYTLNVQKSQDGKSVVITVTGKNGYNGVLTATAELPKKQEENGKKEQTSGNTNTAKTTVTMYRLYNPNSGEHFYTTSVGERKALEKAGWKNEGAAWTNPKEGVPVYRLYNPNAGDHHYTTSVGERRHLEKLGWKNEGIGWYASLKGKPVYRLYNPNAKGAGAHHYTTSKGERNFLVEAGWKAEGIGWYAL